MFKEIVDDTRQTPDIGRSQKLTMFFSKMFPAVSSSRTWDYIVKISNSLIEHALTTKN